MHRVTVGFTALTLIFVASVLLPHSAQAAGPVSVTLTASQTTVAPGTAVTLTWNTSSGDMCSGTGTDGSGSTSGSKVVTPTVTTTYTATCVNTEPPQTSGSASRTITVTSAQSDITAGSVTPTSATAGSAVTLSATIFNSGAASTGAGFTNLFQRATDSGGTNTTDIGTHSGAAIAAGGSITASLSYTFPSAATWYVRACGDKNSAASAGTITESNESNNCGAWTAVVVSAPAATPTATISVSPTSISTGQSSTITWSSTNATGCTASGAWTGAKATSGTQSVSPSTSSTYSIYCTGAGGNSTTVSATVTVTAACVPDGQYSVNAPDVSPYPEALELITDGACCSGTALTGAQYYNDHLCGGFSSCEPETIVETWYTTSATQTVFYNEGLTSPADCGYEAAVAGYAYWNETVAYNPYQVDPYTTTCVGFQSVTGTISKPSGGAYTYRSGAACIAPGTPSAALSASPASITSGSSSVLTWSSTNATSCTGTNFSTGNATGGSTSVSPTSNTTYTVTCTSASGSASSQTTVTVTQPQIDFTAGTPSLNTGSLVSGDLATFKGNITNGGTSNTGATFSNRFQVDLSNNGSWDTNLDASNSITGLNTAQTKEVTSPSWTVVSGTHAIRLCADSPTSVVTETNESNNCGSSYVFSVSAPPNAPIISGPTTGFTNTSYLFSFQATDPGGNTIRYAVDWDYNGTIDEYLPASGYVASGLYRDAYRSWSTTGAKTFKAWTQNSLGASSGHTQHTITISTAPPPPPTAVLTVSPSSVTAGGSATLTWSSSNATSCTGTGFNTGSATAGSVSTGPLYATTAYSVTCSGTTPPADTDTATVTVQPAPDFTSGVPGINSGLPYAGQTLTFWANVTNGGAADTSATFSNRFQVDLNANGSWDVNLDATNSITGLVVGQSKQAVSPGWTAVLGTHRIRLCADAPTSAVAESDESNNCSTSFLSFTVAEGECDDGIDNNGNGFVDLADAACSGASDPTEEVLPSALLTLTAVPSGSLAVEGVVPEGTSATLDWAVTDVVEGSCAITGTNGDSWALSGFAGTLITSPISAFTAFTLTCEDLNTSPVSLTVSVRVTPSYEEL